MIAWNTVNDKPFSLRPPKEWVIRWCVWGGYCNRTTIHLKKGAIFPNCFSTCYFLPTFEWESNYYNCKINILLSMNTFRRDFKRLCNIEVSKWFL